MPGLSQLKKLSEDVLKLGDEPKLRAERGEKPVIATIPPTVEDIDDSEDFVLGMPEKPQEEVAENENDQSEAEALAQAAGDLDSILSENAAPQEAAPIEPDLSSLLNPMAEADDGEPDLSAFEEPPEPPKKKEPSIADMDLDALLSMPSEDFSEPEPEPEPEPVKAAAPKQEYKAPAGPDIFADIAASSFKEEPSELDEVEDLDLDEPVADSFDEPASEAFAEPVPPAVDLTDDLNSDFEIPSSTEEDDEFAYSGESIDMTEDLPDELKEVPGDAFKAKLAKVKKELEPEPEAAAGKDAESVSDAGVGIDAGDEIETGDGIDAGSDDFVMPDITGAEFESEPVKDEIPTSGDFGFDPIDTSGLADFGSMGDITGAMDDAASFDLDSSMQADFSVPETGADTGAETGGDSDFDPASLDLSGLNLGDDSDESGAGFDENVQPEVFDTSEMDGVDFGGSEGMADFNIQDTDTQLSSGNDFELDSAGAGEPDFEIAGYTGADANPFDKSGRIKSHIPEPAPDERRKNTLTDAEYKRFKENLKFYPLNVRIAVEELIVKNEFTDDVIFEVVEKILKKVPARQLASHLEKMLDISLPVPRDFERRTAEEYEAYKKSLQYQLKNRIIPAVIIGVFVFMVGFCSVYLGIEFIYKPIKAENYYKQGYALIENNEYPQSEVMFEKAVDLKVKKKWFFRYANGYRDHNQYDRAEKMYKRILYVFDHDKKGGLEYVHMELDDLANYEKAEDILRREVLDYHINDADALLLLGDIFLEWGTEVDSSKFQDAYEQYTFLCQKYGAKDEYLARLMRYHVRTDSLKDVLSDKEYFYDDEDSLEAKDWTEMSGYLMDKLYGQLTPREEYLRSSIEDVYSMLVRAIEKDPSDPISRYNMSRYYIESGDHLRAGDTLKKTIQLFDDARHLKARDTYKQLNTYRLLGEEYIYNRDYILASETLTQGIDLFEDKEAESGFDSDKNIGVMYSDMGDLDYFISGDLEAAKLYYEKSIRNKNDNSSVRYRVGYIDYQNKEYDEAFKNFIVASQDKVDDSNLLLALGNTLALRDDNYASAGYYDRLIGSLNLEIEKKDILMPQVNEEDTQIVDAYMKATNNLGVVQFRLARQTGDSSMNGKSIYNFQNSLRAWDSLTRNRTSLERLGGTNLAEQNVKYVTSPITSYEPAIYTDIPRILENEKPLE